MVYYEVGVKELINKLGNDAILHCKEEFTGIEFDTTNYEILLANNIVNSEFSRIGLIRLEDILKHFEFDIEALTPLQIGDLHAGWNWCCFDGHESAEIDFYVRVTDKGYDPEFIIGYVLGPCIGCKDCSGDKDGHCLLEDAYEYHTVDLLNNYIPDFPPRFSA